MSKISIGTPDKASPVAMPAGFAGTARTQAYFDQASDHLHLHQHDFAPGDTLRIGPHGTDCVAYVWKGEVRSGDKALRQGSSMVIEHGAQLDVAAGADGATLLAFTANGAPQTRAGGHVHLLPDERVPRYAPEPGAGGAAGGLHADGECETCHVWLHENALPGMDGEGLDEVAERGVHSHSEDEIIFITRGSMRLGHRLVGPGTALAISADTMYSFTPGPVGLSFVNFRPGRPAAFRMKSGGTFDEAGYWRDRVKPPEYLAV